MTDIQEQLLNLLSHAMFDVPTDVTVNQEILDEAKAQAVSSLITTDYKTVAKNMRVINAHSELTELLTDIPFTTFKGYASANYYPDPAMRPMGDVDFIVAPEYYQVVVELLLNSGWEKVNENHDRHEAFYKNKIVFELHREIKGIPNGADGIETEFSNAEEKVRLLLSDLIATAVTVDTQLGPVVIPDDFHHGLIMLLHVAGHMINDGGVGLRHLCDWAVYVNSVDLEMFKERLQSVGLWTFACQLTALCIKYLGLSERTWVGDQSDVFLSALIDDIFAAGNFGYKEAGRRATLEYERTSLAEMTKKRYPAAKHKVLLPLFMVINLMRFAIMLITGKKKLIKPSTFIGAKGRNDLYKQFRLFEV